MIYASLEMIRKTDEKASGIREARDLIYLLRFLFTGRYSWLKTEAVRCRRNS